MTNIYEVLDDMFIESSDYEFVLSLEDINEIVQYAGKLGAKRNRTPKIYTEEQKLQNKARMEILNEKKRIKKEQLKQNTASDTDSLMQ